MYINPDMMGQLARDRQREVFAEARQRQLRRQARNAPRTPRPPRAAGLTLTRRLAAAFAKAGIATTGVPL